MIKLFVEETKLQSPTVRLQWCIEPETLRLLREKKAEKPYLLIVTYADNREKTHQLAPLDQLEEYVALPCSGENKIFAAIVWAEKNEFPYLTLWKKYLRRERNHYANYMVAVHTWDGGHEFDCMLRDNNLGFANITVVVPSKLFAKEPAEWEKRWVNLWYDYPPFDQCQFKKRRIPAYSIQPLVIFMWLIAKPLFCIIATIFLLIFWMDNAVRHIDLRPLFHPWKFETKTLWYFVEDEPNIFARIWKYTLGKMFTEMDKEDESIQRQKMDRIYDDYSRLLLCDRRPSDPRTVLPTSYKIYLAFRDLKAKHCRPFAS
ncbi:hypothetical protein A2739_01425 [Candidatus Giovannonibacteria bacterium RIFCSPHIGHO2_01_FULL_43_100]|nr:MAG: hypothetical protein A2739_01425 [Candidatus Giovannonibacteria bacterium RIFCSPHIGHO2_01_FULL_43_100]